MYCFHSQSDINKADFKPNCFLSFYFYLSFERQCLTLVILDFIPSEYCDEKRGRKKSAEGNIGTLLQTATHTCEEESKWNPKFLIPLFFWSKALMLD